MYDMRNQPYYGGEQRFFAGPFIGGLLGGVLGSALFFPRPFAPYPFYPPVGFQPYGFGYGYPFY
ncbi:hypothetical protein D1B31_03260 [Neobacillus notoginsengisoli]|uniref:Uncharacterized protein n=1 Tax=Neobacillus notoginsengisoli TaxID=1578198 RepID=A0A417YYB0_9BACI|nr:hypothetical protein [Neobacillus notoginsengisoli]RHW42625.1 hypothetical protein D1B31_03260 [Neobacillus notoginsengisoli]